MFLMSAYRGYSKIKLLFGLIFWALLVKGCIYYFDWKYNHVESWPDELAKTKEPQCNGFDLVSYATSGELSSNCQEKSWFGIYKSSLETKNGMPDYRLLNHICLDDFKLDSEFTRILVKEVASKDIKHDYLLCGMKDLKDLPLNETIEIIRFYALNAERFLESD